MDFGTVFQSEGQPADAYLTEADKKDGVADEPLIRTIMEDTAKVHCLMVTAPHRNPASSDVKFSREKIPFVPYEQTRTR